MAKILIVDDDSDMLDLVRRALAISAFSADENHEGYPTDSKNRKQ